MRYGTNKTQSIPVEVGVSMQQLGIIDPTIGLDSRQHVHISIAFCFLFPGTLHPCRE